MKQKNSLKSDLKSEKVVFGTKVVENKLRNANLKRIYLANNFKDKDKLLRLCKAMGLECNIVDEDNMELAVICKKPYSVSCVGVE